MNEQWKLVSNSDYYEISDKGNFRNIRTGINLKPPIDRYGYRKITYRDREGNKVYTTIHRVVAKAWIPNPDVLPQVNHIDGNKLNKFVYDCTDDSLKEYKSILIAAYHTGIRSLSNIDKTDGYMSLLGYQLSFDKDRIGNYTVNDVSKICDDRKRYLSALYKRRDINYYIYDYYSGIETRFDDYRSFFEHIVAMEPIDRVITESTVASAVNRGVSSGRTGLIKGFGVKSDNCNYDWFQYPEEVILSSRLNLPAPNRIYRVKDNDNTIIVTGMFNLCKYFNYISKRELKNISHEEIEQSLNDPKIHIQRLDKPIKLKLLI